MDVCFKTLQIGHVQLKLKYVELVYNYISFFIKVAQELFTIVQYNLHCLCGINDYSRHKAWTSAYMNMMHWCHVIKWSNISQHYIQPYMLIYHERHSLKLYYIKSGQNFSVYILRNPSEFRASDVPTNFFLGRDNWTHFIWSQLS